MAVRPHDTKFKCERENRVQVCSAGLLVSLFYVFFCCCGGCCVVDPGLDETDRVRPVDPGGNRGGIHLGSDCPPRGYRHHQRAAVTEAVVVVAAIRGGNPSHFSLDHKHFCNTNTNKQTQKTHEGREKDYSSTYRSPFPTSTYLLYFFVVFFEFLCVFFCIFCKKYFCIFCIF